MHTGRIYEGYAITTTGNRLREVSVQISTPIPFFDSLHLVQVFAGSKTYIERGSPRGVSLSETIEVLETLANVPYIYLIGSTKDRVIYHSNLGGPFTLWSANVEDGSKFQITPGPVEQMADPRHDSNTVYYTKDVAKGGELHKIFTADAIEGKESLAVDPPPMRIEGLAFRGNMVAFTGATKDEMGLYTSKAGSLKKERAVPPSATLSDASERFLVGSGVLAKNPRSQELFIFDIVSGKFTEYTPKAGSVNKPPKIDGSKVLFESNFTGRNRLHVYDVESGELGPAQFGHEEYAVYGAIEHQNYGWTDDGKVWFVGKKEGECEAFVDGEQFPTPQGYIPGMTVLKDKAYVIHTTAVQPSTIIEASPGMTSNPAVVENSPPPSVSERVGKGRMVHFQSFDGREISALVIDHGSARRAVVLVHGGPWSEYPNTWGPIICSIAASGYNVIAPNYRGSTGYGEEFRLLDIGDPGGADLNDVVTATNWAKQNGLATETAIMGYSYGGYTTLLGLGKEPELWSCGVAGAPVVDWKEMYGLSDALYREFVEVLFDRKMELLDDRSPITYVKNVKKPLCIIASQNDSRTPLKPVLRYVTELANHPGTFEFHAIPDAGHTAPTSQDLIDILLPGIAFLHRHFAPVAT
jgi:dienelactone hydrolase